MTAPARELTRSEGLLLDLIARLQSQLAWARDDLGADVEQPTCRFCGCTELTACDDGGVPCAWAAPDICTACVEVAELAEILDTDRADR